MGVFEFLWSTGLISDQTYKQLNLVCANQSFVHPSESCDEILEMVDKEIGNIDPYSIFTPPCSDLSSNRLRSRMHVSLLINVLVFCFSLVAIQQEHE